MKKRTGPAPLGREMASVELAWLSQPGRVQSRASSMADGFRARPPFASVAVVAECARDDHECASTSVAIVRDTFSEGVAHGAGEALKDAFDSLSQAWSHSGHTGCSAAAVATIGNEAWVAGIGSCNAFMADRGSDGSVDIHRSFNDIGDSGATLRIRKVVLREGQSIILTTHSLRKLMGSSAAAKYTSGCRDVLPVCLRTLIKETRIQFRKRGGSVAAVRMGSTPPAISYRKAGITLLAGAAAIAGILALAGLVRGCGGGTGEGADRDSTVTTPVVMPLEPVPVQEPDSTPVTAPDTVETMFIPSVPTGVDTGELSVTLSGSIPDNRWENAPAGIYHLEGDSTAAVAAGAVLEDLSGAVQVVPVSTVIVVRQDLASLFSSWLRTVPPDVAGSTAVVVETGTSVAGGASWIRDFALFANGSRIRQDLPSCFTGDSIPGIPAPRGTSTYRLIVVP